MLPHRGHRSPAGLRLHYLTEARLAEAVSHFLAMEYDQVTRAIEVLRAEKPLEGAAPKPRGLIDRAEAESG